MRYQGVAWTALPPEPFTVPSPSPRTDPRHRVSRRCSALRAAATALEEGTSALAAAAEQEDAFYAQLARLQRFWLVGGRLLGAAV